MTTAIIQGLYGQNNTCITPLSPTTRYARKFSEYSQYNYQSSKSFPHKSISDGAFHKLHPTNSPIANKKIKYIIIVQFVSMSYNNTVNWIKVHSTQNCCFSYVYFSMQRVYYLVFVYENEQFCAR